MQTFRTLLPRLWSGETPTGLAARCLVLPALMLASLPYRAAVAVRNRLYDSGTIGQTKLSCPVISIGNITVGGTGKTPLTIMLATLLREQGYRPAVLSRGYGGKGRPLCVVSDRGGIRATAEEAGDEPLLMARSLKGIPVVTGADRVMTGRYAIRNLGATVLVLDDAFQHRRLFRDLDIVLMRSTDPFGNGRLLPRGPLREPLASLKRAHAIVLSGTSAKDSATASLRLSRGFPSLPAFRAYYRPAGLFRPGTEAPEAPESLRGRRVCAFAGIANPTSFRETLESLGADIVAFLVFPDHHPYSLADIARIGKTCADSCADVMVTTEKDAVRVSGLPASLQEVLCLRVEIDILPSSRAFAEFIIQRIRR